MPKSKKKPKNKKTYAVRENAPSMEIYQYRLAAQKLERTNVSTDRQRCLLSADHRLFTEKGKKFIWVHNTLVDKGFQVGFEHMATVRKVKHTIAIATGIPWQKQILVYQDSFVLDEDTQMIEDLKRPLRFSLMVNFSFQYIVIRDKSDNTTFIMEVDFEDNVSSMYEKIKPNQMEKRNSCPATNRILIFRGRVLDPNMSISAQKIVRGDPVVLQRYMNAEYPRKVFIETGGKNKKGVRVGPFFCDPNTSIYDLKVRFINSTAAPKGKFRIFSSYNELKDHMTMAELDLCDSATLRAEMPTDPLYHMKPRSKTGPVEESDEVPALPSRESRVTFADEAGPSTQTRETQTD